ncbi:hypothetical protein [Nonomuraea sp. NPDC050643]|uniref:hypothetical protein n=1 Tax=Nonomuraea sp. NPDC050643 TaxID=3155660 RepID=UPI0033C77C93
MRLWRALRTAGRGRRALPMVAAGLLALGPAGFLGDTPGLPDDMAVRLRAP